MNTPLLPILGGIGIGIGVGAAVGVATQNGVVGAMLALGLSVVWSVVFTQAQQDDSAGGEGGTE